jgi:class 3 adenylate cyclase
MLGGPVALSYAANNPHSVSRIVLVSAFAQGERLATPERQRALIDYTERMGFPVLEYSESPDPSAALDRTGRDVVHLASTPELQARLLRLFFTLDVTSVLPAVTMPVTIAHGRDDRLVPSSEGRALAAQLPNAEFVSFEGNTGSALTEAGATIPVVRRGLGLPPLPESTATSASFSTAHDTAIILFADIVESTALTEKIGDGAFRERARALDLAMRSAIMNHQGAPVEGKLLGDGVLATFASARQAIECGKACVASASETGLQLHVGIHAGDVIREVTNVYGGAVNIASRIAAASAPNQVLVSDTVRGLARTSAGVSFIDKGTYALKGIDEPQRVFEVL